MEEEGIRPILVLLGRIPHNFSTFITHFAIFGTCKLFNLLGGCYPARALRALRLLLADGTPTGGRGEDFLSRQPDFFTETALTPERKVEKSFPRSEINRHAEG